MLRSKISSLREFITPVSKDSQYSKNGTITPDEFVMAGNYLADKFITWSWNSNDREVSEGDLKTRSFLPKEKQFLVTRKVICYKRCADLAKLNESEENGEVEEFDEENNVWIIKTSSKEKQTKDTLKQTKEPSQQSDVPEDESGYAFEEEELEEGEEESINSNLEDTMDRRYYDLYILYSTSYRVPKLYLVGYNNEGQPLTPKQMLEDVSPEYRKKTVTIEDLPVFKTKTPSISIHPCRHGDVMKLLLLRMKESKAGEGGEEIADHDITVDSYLVIFLKFMNSVVPTMQYDFTMEGG